MADPFPPAGLGAFAAMLPAGLSDMLEQAQTALEAQTDGDAAIHELAARLKACEERLEVVTTNLELTLELWARLVPAWNATATNLEALTTAMATPLARLGLKLVPIPRV